LVSKGGTIYLGEFSRIEKNTIYFKPTKASAFQGVPINQVQSLKLKDGQTIIKNGNINKIGTFVDYEKLSVEEKAIIIGVTALIGAWIILSSFDMSGYDACFDPRCD
jgi:hypothetical protein